MPASRSTPKYKVKIDGQPLPAALSALLREIHVDRSVELADTFALAFDNERSRVSDDELIKPGKKVEIELGYEEGGGRTLPVFEGEITAVRASFPRRGPLTVRVQGYTKVHRLRRGRQTRAWTDKTYSAIAEAIAQEVGLEPEVEATGPVHEYVFQRNQSNFEFLLELAARVGYEVFATERKLRFRKPAQDGSAALTLKKGETLLSFNPQIRAARVPAEVKAQGFDGREKRTFTGTASGPDAGPLLGGRTSAAALAEKLGPAPKGAIHDLGLRDEPQAKAVATSALRAAAQDLVHAWATVAGAPELFPGSVVSIEGVGDIFTGDYYVRRVIHAYLRDGFSTQLMLSRSSIEKAPAPPPAPPGPPPSSQTQAPPGFEVVARVVDEASGQPLANHPYEIVDPSGNVVATGTTDWQGNVRHVVPQPGQYTVRGRPGAGAPAGPSQSPAGTPSQASPGQSGAQLGGSGQPPASGGAATAQQGGAGQSPGSSPGGTPPPATPPPAASPPATPPPVSPSQYEPPPGGYREWVRVSAEKGCSGGYTNFQIGSEFADDYNAAHAEVIAAGGIIPSSGGRRNLSAEVTPGRSATSLHYIGRAIDLCTQCAMQGPNDRLIAVRDGQMSDGRPKWKVYCVVPAGSPGSQQMTLQAYIFRGHREIPRTEHVICLTDILARHNWTRICARSNWRNDYMCVEWWHFQNEKGLTPSRTFGDELRMFRDYRRPGFLEASEVAAHLNKRWRGGYFG